MNEGVLDSEQQALREEFNRWAERGKGASMERHHAPITEQAIVRMHLKAGDRALDLGCGSGWAARRLAREVGPRGLVVGVDISDAMIREAQAGDNPPNVRFFSAPAEHIPAEDGLFTHVLSVESFYYYADQRAVLDELQRVLAPGGRLLILMCLFRGNPKAEEWRAGLAVPVHLMGANEYLALLRIAGWQEATATTFAPDPAEANPDPHGYALLLEARRAG